MDFAPKRSHYETDWTALADAVETVHSLPHTDEFNTLLREHRLRETTILTPSASSRGICIQEDMLGASNFSGLFGASNITIQDFSLAVDTFNDEATSIHGTLSANGTGYRIEQHGDMLLFTETESPELPGFSIEPEDVKQLLAAQIATYCDEDPAMVATILSSLHEINSTIDSLHSITFAFGNIAGTSTRRISASFDSPEIDKALIVQYSETETPKQSEYGTQLDIGYVTEVDAFAAGELLTHELSVPNDTDQDTSSYDGVTIPTDMSPPDVVDFVRLNGRLDKFDTLLGTHIKYPPVKKSEAKAYGELCQQLLEVIEPELREIATR